MKDANQQKGKHLTRTEIQENEKFALFIHKFMKQKWGKKPKVVQECCDLMASVEYHSKESPDVLLFSKFLAEEYETAVLVFFLYLRHLLEREVKVKFSKFGLISTK